MSKTIILDDETYNTLKKEAKAEDRSICKTAKRLIQMGLQAKTVTQAMTQAMTPVAISESKTMTIEEFNERERQRIEKSGHKRKEYDEPELTEEELFAMNKKLKERQG